jgi:hypothetical protein
VAEEWRFEVVVGRDVVVDSAVLDAVVPDPLVLGAAVVGSLVWASNVTPVDSGSVPLRSVPETAPATKMSTASTSTRRQRRPGADVDGDARASGVAADAGADER